EDSVAPLLAPLDQVVDPLLCLAALDVSGVHQLSHDLLGPATADLSEDGPCIEVLANALIACHFTRVSGVLAGCKHFWSGESGAVEGLLDQPEEVGRRCGGPGV